MAPRGHRTDEHTGIGGVILHAHTVAEDRATGEWRRRINGQHGNFQTLAAQMADRRAGQRALARAWRAGDPHQVAIATQGMGQPGDLLGLVAAAFDQ